MTHQNKLLSSLLTSAKGVETLIEIKSAKPKAKGIVIEEQSEFTPRTRPQQLPLPPKGKAKAMIDADYQMAQKMQAEEQEQLSNEEKLREVQVSKKSSKKQKLEVDKESEELLCLEIIPDDEDEVTIDATPLVQKLILSVQVNVIEGVNAVDEEVSTAKLIHSSGINKSVATVKAHEVTTVKSLSQLLLLLILVKLGFNVNAVSRLLVLLGC
ncbi:hypothetical protein Tco_1556789 [Tanacetum coccineum]